MTATFEARIRSVCGSLKKRKIQVLQVNLGQLCNLTCTHCHVEAGPAKTQNNMSQNTAEAVVRAMDELKPETVDITGGAPEMNPNFRSIVREARQRHLQVIDRCNLTVFFLRGQEDLPDFLASKQVEIIASLPCYSKKNVDTQRGRGTFDESISALQWLNRLGYGRPDGRLVLNLVYNPVGAHLPPSQKDLEKEYKDRLIKDYDITFNRLFTIANMPITRYKKYLEATGNYKQYTNLLRNNFNSETINSLMCVNTLSVGWDGSVYDCDFNLAQGMHWRGSAGALNISDLKTLVVEGREILMDEHCFGCTAGFGSSCQGTLENEVP